MRTVPNVVTLSPVEKAEAALLSVQIEKREVFLGQIEKDKSCEAYQLHFAALQIDKQRLAKLTAATK